LSIRFSAHILVLLDSQFLIMHIYDLVEQYHKNTEEYDRTICTARKAGVAIPTTAEERILVNNYARRWRQCIMDLGYSSTELQRALQYYRLDIKTLLGL